MTQKSTVAERYEFHKCKQAERQSVRDFVVEIKRKAAGCKFGGFLNEALRDKIVCGVTSENLIKKFLTEGEELTFVKAYEIAIAFESAERESKSMQPDTNNVCIVHEKRTTKNPFNSCYECTRCGGQHSAEKCLKKTWTCFICKKQGHIALKCRNRRNKQAVKYMDEESNRQELQTKDSETEDIILGSIMSIYHEGEGPAEVNM